jgi:purine-binding chemotaxis protein CheW
MTPPAVVRFQLGGRPHALPLPEVAELADLPEPVPVPGAPPAVAGLSDLRGRVVTVIDLARLLRLGEERRESGRCFAILLAAPFGHIALTVEGDVKIATGLDPAPPPGIPAGAEDRAMAGGECVIGPGTPEETALPDAEIAIRLEARRIVQLCSREVRGRFRIETEEE